MAGASRDWRKAEDYSDIAAMSPQDLAWQYLRRNPAYQAAFIAARGVPDTTRQAIATTWGLRFPG